jgi:hypothetical protein
MVDRRRVLIAVLAVATVIGIVALQAIDDARSRTPITGSTTTTTSPATKSGVGKFAPSASSATVCGTLVDLVPNAALALVGDASVTSEQSRTIARDLRSITRRARLPATVRVAVRKLARFFDRASTGIPLTELGSQLGQIATALVTVGRYTARACAGTTTSSTTRPLR